MYSREIVWIEYLEFENMSDEQFFLKLHFLCIHLF